MLRSWNVELLAGRGSAAGEEDPAAGLPITSFMLQLRCGNPQELNSCSFHRHKREPPPMKWLESCRPRAPNEKGRLLVQATLGSELKSATSIPRPICSSGQHARCYRSGGCPNVSPGNNLNPLRRRSDNAYACPFLAWPLEISCDPFATVAGKSDSQRHLGRSSQYLFTRPRRYAPDSALPFYLRSNSAKVLPKRAGDGETLMPAASMAAILLSASPLPPEMMAPAWPIRRPGGAVRPAMNPTIGFLRPRLASSARNWAASSSAEPPISPIITIASVALSAKNIASTSMNSVPFTGSPPMPTAVVWPSPTRVV